MGVKVQLTTEAQRRIKVRNKDPIHRLHRFHRFNGEMSGDKEGKSRIKFDL